MTAKTKRNIRTTPAAPAAGDLLRLDNQLCFALYAASGMVTRAYRPLLEPLGQALDLDSGTLTPLLKRLEAAGFVTRRRDPEDERKLQVELTAAGQALREKAAEVPAALACQLHLPIEDIVELRATLQDLARRMKGA